MESIVIVSTLLLAIVAGSLAQRKYANAFVPVFLVGLGAAGTAGVMFGELLGWAAAMVIAVITAYAVLNSKIHQGGR